jgi:cellulose synthase/poly-beta-1,6-N-acetylglucosamine synthase-like glycosyltransferase
MAIVTIIIISVLLYSYALAFISWRAGKPPDSGSDDLFFVLLVPALNEEHVIGDTLRSLLGMRGNFRVLVVDDASDDGTVRAIDPFLADPRVRLLRQPPEQARRGKGHALNTGLAAVHGMDIAALHSQDDVIVVVFDSDARVQPDFLEAVAPYFRDPEVVGVQSAVRMYNADHNILTLWQHIEFAIWGRIFCRAKNVLGSATLGGNGQCVRLSALAELGVEPWQPSSLTEDLDLSLRLLMRNGQMRFCPEVSVWQEAVPGVRALVRQRGRWLQGHVVCWQYLPALLRSRLPVRARLDLLVFMLLPAAFLPVGLIGVYALFRLLLVRDDWNLANSLTGYVLGFGIAPLVVWAWRQADGVRHRRLLVHGHLYIFYSFVWLLSGLTVYWHVVAGSRAWVKTARLAPRAASLPALRTEPAGLGVGKLEPDRVGTLLATLLDDARTHLRAERGSVMVLDPATNTLAVRAGNALPAEAMGSARVRVGEGVAGWVAETGRALVIDGRTLPREVEGKLRQRQLRSSIVVPVEGPRGPVAVLSVSSATTLLGDDAVLWLAGRVRNVLTQESQATVER